jgi:hypothetical protein
MRKARPRMMKIKFRPQYLPSSYLTREMHVPSVWTQSKKKMTSAVCHAVTRFMHPVLTHGLPHVVPAALFAKPTIIFQSQGLKELMRPSSLMEEGYEGPTCLLRHSTPSWVLEE